MSKENSWTRLVKFRLPMRKGEFCCFWDKRKNLKTMRKWSKILVQDQRGFTLVEVLLSIAILAIIGVAIAFALGTSSKTLLHTNMNQRARNFAEYEMESLVYPVSNSVQTGTGSYVGFTATIAATTVNTGEQQISITVTGNNIHSYTLTDYKVQ